MKVEISHKLNQYLEKEGVKALTIDFEETKACCGQPDLPTVKLGQPPHFDNYSQVKERGIDVFINRRLKVPEGLIKLDLYSFLFAREITIEGVQKY